MVISMFVRIAWNGRAAPAAELRNRRRLAPVRDRGYDLGPIRDFHKMTRSLFDRQD